MSVFRRAFIAASVGWAALLPLAPFAASQPAPAPFWYGLAFVVYGAGSVICHQLPARSFHTWSAQWPVCARCTGIYFGAALTAVIVMVRLKADPTYDTVRLKPDTTYVRVTNPRRARVMLLAAALPTAMTLVYEWTTGDMPSNAIRALAGLPLGAAIAFVVLEALRVERTAAPSASKWGRTLSGPPNVN